MGIVERLRGRAAAARSENTGTSLGHASHFDEAADLIERLKGYADHTPYCQSRIKGLHENPCTCGLSALIKEIEGD